MMTISVYKKNDLYVCVFTPTAPCLIIENVQVHIYMLTFKLNNLPRIPSGVFYVKFNDL